MIRKVVSVKINDDMGYIDLYREESGLYFKKVDILAKIGYKNGFCARLADSNQYVTKKGNNGRLTDFVDIKNCFGFIKNLPCTALRRMNANRLSDFFEDLCVISAGLSSCDDEEFVKKLSLDVDIYDDKDKKDDAQKKIEMLQVKLIMYGMAFAKLASIIDATKAKLEEGTC